MDTVIRVLALGGLALAVVACDVQKSRNPLSPDVAGPIPGVSITAPKPLEPANGQTIVSTAQPAMLLFENASSTGERPIWHIVELAADTNFSEVLYTSQKLPPGANGRATLSLPALTPGRTYYWRVKAEDGANAGPHSEIRSFQVVPPVVIESPVPVSPINNQVTSSPFPFFVMNNGVVSGPARDVDYQIEVAKDQQFREIIATGQARRSSGQTTTLTLALPPGMQLFWRARGSDRNVTSPWSPVQVFRTPVPPVPEPPPAPSPGPPSPAPVPAPAPSTLCGPQPLGADRLACVQAVAASSVEWRRCTAGDGVACHRFTREVARALAAADPNWGLLGKGPGQWQCTPATCGGLGGEGFGEDIVNYCTNPATCRQRNRNDGRNDWQGFDIVVGAGQPGASLSWQMLPQSWNRGNNFWAPVP